MHRAFFVLIQFHLIFAQPYVPGTPGATWTQDEMAIVKAKLYSMFSATGGADALKQIYNGHTPTQGKNDKPNAAKMLRLSFHDCLK